MLSSIRDLSIEQVARNPVRGLDPVAFDNFQQVVAVRPDDRVLLLMDRTIDPRVVSFLWDFARGRGAEVNAVTVDRAGSVTFPEPSKGLIEDATLVLSTWFSSSVDPYFLKLRKDTGQRYVKLTYFRSLDLMTSEAARFPVDLISLLIRRTAAAYPTAGPAVVRVTDPRGTDLEIRLEPHIITRLLSQSRWRGEMTAEQPGAYVHWIPTHGPNFWDFTACDESFREIDGTIAPRLSVGFPDGLPGGARVTIERNRVTSVDGPAEEQTTAVLRDMLLDGCLIEIGCGFNPKHPRNQLYPAGSNSAGAIHLGLDIPGDSDFLNRHMPDWPEPPEHVDLVLLDATVTVNDVTVVDDGVLVATRDPQIREAASRYGEPAYLLDQWPYV